MLSKLWMSFKVSFGNIKSNVLHTLLSVLGIVIGVAALVTILSLIDGMEAYARKQITQTTSLESIMVDTRHRREIDGVWVKNESPPIITPELVDGLRERFNKNVSVHLMVNGSATIESPVLDTTTAVYFTAVDGSPAEKADSQIRHGSSEGFGEGNTAFISYSLARQFQKNNPQEAIGNKVSIKGREYTVGAVLKESAVPERRIVFPFYGLSDTELAEHIPRLTVKADNIENVAAHKITISDWLAENFEHPEENFSIYTNQMRVEQARRGMLLFKIVMGLITGIAVVVGGIGIMNVLLISITERTSEIGIRKAAGAKKFDIVLQFLSESVTISVFGSFLGTLVGILAAFGSVALIRTFVDVPFQAGFSMGTVGIIAVLAVVIGIAFGTYPAYRAAKLTPVEAIRRV